MLSIPGSKKRKADATYEEQPRESNVAITKTQLSHEKEVVSTLKGRHNLRSSMPIEPFNCLYFR